MSKSFGAAALSVAALVVPTRALSAEIPRMELPPSYTTSNTATMISAASDMLAGICTRALRKGEGAGFNDALLAEAKALGLDNKQAGMAAFYCMAWLSGRAAERNER